MGVIASGRRIAWHRGHTAGYLLYCTEYRSDSVAHTVCTRTRAAATSNQVRHRAADQPDRQTDQQFFRPADCCKREREGEGEGGEKQPPPCAPQAVTLLSPFGPTGSLPPRQPPARLLQRHRIGPRHSSFC